MTCKCGMPFGVHAVWCGEGMNTKLDKSDNPALKDFDLSNDPQSKFEWKVLGSIAFRREWKQDAKCDVCKGWHHGNEIIGKFKLLGGLPVYSICETCLSKWEARQEAPLFAKELRSELDKVAELRWEAIKKHDQELFMKYTGMQWQLERTLDLVIPRVEQGALAVAVAISEPPLTSVLDEMKRDSIMLKSGLFQSDPDQKLREEGAISCLDYYVPRLETEAIKSKAQTK